jgi:hypothetical protein
MSVCVIVLSGRVGYGCRARKWAFIEGILNRMEQSEMQNVILKLASNDYEATDTIMQNVRDELGRAVSNKSFSTLY